MPEKIIYQTLEQRFNLPEVERDGPYACNNEYAWLGDGYYFWDTFIENAEWWGEECRSDYQRGYIICKALCEFDDSKCLDLVGNTNHMIQFHELVIFVKNQKQTDGGNTLLSTVFHFLLHSKLLNFEATRVQGELVKSKKSKYSINYYFDHKRRSFLELKPPIQICLYSKSSLGLRDYQVVKSIVY